MVNECNKTLSDYQLCQVTERQVNHCCENYSPIVIRAISQSSDDEDRDGIRNTGLFAFQPPDMAGSPKVLLQHFTFVFWCNQIGLRTQNTQCVRKNIIHQSYGSKASTDHLSKMLRSNTASIQLHYMTQ